MSHNNTEVNDIGKFLKEFLCNYENDICSLKSVSKMNGEIETYEKRLKQNLSKEQKKLLLRIEDEKDLLIEKTNAESFIAGFKLGLKVGYEVNKD